MTALAPVRRSMDADHFNAVANHPEVRPYLGGEGALDLSEAIKSPRNFALKAKDGGFLLICHDVGIYETHTMFLPAGRGAGAVRAMRDGFRFMFLQTDATVIRSRFPLTNARAVAFGKLAGFNMLYERDDTVFGRTAYGEVTIEKWAANTPELEAEGHAFHGSLEAAKIASGSQLAVHPEDPIHERMVGAAFQMCRHGQSEKGVLTYNRWALLAGYAPITLVSAAPVLIDVGDALVTLQNQTVEIIQCR